MKFIETVYHGACLMGGGRMEEGTLVTQTQLWRGEMIPPEKPGGSSGKPCQWRGLGHKGLS